MTESTRLRGDLHAEPLGHVPALDGLRAVAVAAVLLYHSELSWASGGFLGVSVFFTLSGFLITSLLLRDWNHHRGIGLREFWVRRFRRLLPAAWTTLVLVVLMALAGAWDSEQLRSLRGDVPWALAELVNWHFIAQGTSYGDTYSAPSPLAHFWSLAIEEQFYLVLPLLVGAVLGARRPGRNQRGLARLVAVLAALAAASATANLVLARSSLDRAYFGTDTRAAELLVGSLLACATLRRLRLPDGPARRWAAAGAAVGLAVIVWLVHGAALADRWLYPWGLLLTAASTAAVVFGAVQGGVVSRVLSARPLVALGRISYGVYLLHWPVFVWLDPGRTGWSPLPLFLARVTVSVAGASLMLHFIENPVRYGRRVEARTAAVVVPITVTCLIGGILALSRDLPPPPDFLTPRDGEVTIQEAPTTPTTTSTTPATAAPDTPTRPSSPPTTAPPPPIPPTRVLLIGDSVAASLEDQLSNALNARGITAATAAAPGCGVVTGHPADAQGNALAIASACDGAIPRLQQDSVAAARPDLVVILSSWEAGDRIVDGRWYGFGTAEGDAVLRRLYEETFARVTATGAKVALVTLPPNVDGARRRADAEVNRRLGLLNEFLVDLAATSPTRPRVLPMDRIVCPTAPCPTAVDGIVLRPGDGTHYDTPEGARYVASRLADSIAGFDLRVR